MANPDAPRYRRMIEELLESYGYNDVTWEEDEDDRDRPRAYVGRFRAIEDGESVFEGDEGKVYVSVVGSDEHKSLRVHVGIIVDGTDEPNETTFDDLEPAD